MASEETIELIYRDHRLPILIDDIDEAHIKGLFGLPDTFRVFIYEGETQLSSAQLELEVNL